MSHRIGLLTPYTGGNLGDAAIQSAAIDRLREHLPGSELIGITLDPETTSRVHGIPCVPLRASPQIARWLHMPPDVRAADERISQPRERPGSSEVAPGLLARARRHLIPPPARRYLIRPLRRLRAELLHTIRAVGAARRLHVLMVSGGGQLDDYWGGGALGQPYALFKWSLAARVTRTPVVVLGVGVGTLRSRAARFFVRRALRMARVVSVRDQGSLDLLRRSGCAPRSVEVAPDLAFSASTPDPEEDRPAKAAPVRLGLSPIAFLDPRIWPDADADAYSAHIALLADTGARAIEQGLEVSLFASDTVDHLALQDLERGLLERRPHDAVRTLYLDDLEGLLAYLGTIDIAVASRLHGILLANLMLVPTLALSYDRKVRQYMSDMALGQLCLELRNTDSGEIAARLRETQRAHDDLRRHLAALRRRQRAALDRQYRTVTDLIAP